MEEEILELLKRNDSELIDLGPDYLKKIAKTKKIFSKQNPDEYKLFDKYIRRFFVLDDDSFGASSHPKVWGAIYITIRLLKSQPEQIVESHIHELAHQELFLINLIDPLVSSEYIQNMHYSPLQNQNRPPIGRLHSCHSLYRMTFVNTNTHDRQKELITLFRENIDSLKNYELTEFAQRLICEVYIPRYNSISVDEIGSSKSSWQ